MSTLTRCTRPPVELGRRETGRRNARLRRRSDPEGGWQHGIGPGQHHTRERLGISPAQAP
jgi:hypothetical protein